MKNFLKNISWYKTSILLVLIVAISFRFCRFSDKETMYGDEFLTVVLSAYLDYGWSELIITGEEGMTGAELKQLLYSDDSGLQNIAMDLWNLRKSTRDIDHANLYYSFLRLSQFQCDTSDLNSVMWRGFLLSMVFFVVGFYYMRKLLDLLLDNEVLKTAILCLAYIIPMSIANSLFLREYHLQETLFVIFTYCYVKHSLLILNSKPAFTPKSILFFALVIALAILSGYLGTLYMLLVGSTMLVLMIYKKRGKKEIFTLFGLAILALLFLLLVYPGFYKAAIGGRSQSMGNLFFQGDAFLASLKASMASLQSEVGAYYVNMYAIYLIFVCGFVLSYKKIKADPRLLLLATVVVCALLWIHLVMFLAPYKYARYVVPVFPIISLFPVLLLVGIRNKTIQYSLSAMIVLFSLIKTYRVHDVYWGNIHIYNNYKEYLDTPLLINGLGMVGLDATLTPHYADDRMVYITFGEDAFHTIVDKHHEICVMTANPSLVPPKGYVVAEEIFSKGEWPFAYYRLVKEE